MKCPIEGIIHVTSEPEEWRDVFGFEGYQVSNLGNIRSFRDRHGGLKKEPSPLRLDSASGQPRVTLCVQAKKKRVSLAHLILEVFGKPKPPGSVVRHLDGNVLNNRLDNLTWGTQRENIQDNIRLGVWPHGESNGTSKLKEGDVREIRSLLTQGLSRHKIANLFNVSRRTVQFIDQGRMWKHV